MIPFPDPDVVVLRRQLPGAVEQNVRDLIGQLAADRAAWRRRGHEYREAWRALIDA